MPIASSECNTQLPGFWDDTSQRTVATDLMARCQCADLMSEIPPSSQSHLCLRQAADQQAPAARQVALGLDSGRMST